MTSLAEKPPSATSRVTLVWLFLYWLAFVRLAIDAGHKPGFVKNPEAVPYPTHDVIGVCVFLGIMASALTWVIHPPRQLSAGAWLALRGAYVAVLFLMLLPCFTTDMPGIVYVPGYYAFGTLIVLAAVSLVRSVKRDSVP